MVQVSPQHVLLSGWLLTNVQINITTAKYDTGHTLMYITLQLLFMFFFTQLLFSWAGWLSSIPFVCYSCVSKSYCRLFTWQSYWVVHVVKVPFRFLRVAQIDFVSTHVAAPALAPRGKVISSLSQCMWQRLCYYSLAWRSLLNLVSMHVAKFQPPFPLGSKVIKSCHYSWRILLLIK
jgi:hypothetical protein